MPESHKRGRQPKYRTSYRVRNWLENEKSLRTRGNVAIWISREAIVAWTPPRTGKRGGYPLYSNLAIETTLTLGLLFHQPLRQAEELFGSILKLMGLDLPWPDHMTLSLRNRTVLVSRRIEALPDVPVNSIVDSMGLKICGQGHWHSKRHGRKQLKRWKKLHIGVDHEGWIHATTPFTSTDEDRGCSAGRGPRSCPSTQPICTGGSPGRGRGYPG